MNINFKVILKNGYFRFIMGVLILIGLFYGIESHIYLSLLMKNLGEYGVIVYSLSFLALSILFTVILLAGTGWIFKRIDLLHYKSMPSSNSNLYTWLGEDEVSEKTLRDIFKDQATNRTLIEYDDIDNLKRVTNILKDKLEDNLLYFKLFRTYLYSKTKKSLFNKINVYLITLLLTFITSLLIPEIKKYLKNSIEDQEIFKILEGFSSYETFSYIIMYISLGFVIYFLAYQLLYVATERNRRVSFLISILDGLIEEKEKENENNNNT